MDISNIVIYLSSFFKPFSFFQSPCHITCIVLSSYGSPYIHMVSMVTLRYILTSENLDIRVNFWLCISRSGLPLPTHILVQSI